MYLFKRVYHYFWRQRDKSYLDTKKLQQEKVWNARAKNQMVFLYGKNKFSMKLIVTYY